MAAYVFHDNICVEDYIKQLSNNLSKFRIDVKQFDDKLNQKLPYVFGGDKLRKLMPAEC